MTEPKYWICGSCHIIQRYRDKEMFKASIVVLEQTPPLSDKIHATSTKKIANMISEIFSKVMIKIPEPCLWCDNVYYCSVLTLVCFSNAILTLNRVYICRSFDRNLIMCNRSFFMKCTSSSNRWKLNSLIKKCSFPLRISSVNMTKSAGICGFGHIYWRNL